MGFECIYFYKKIFAFALGAAVNNELLLQFYKENIPINKLTSYALCSRITLSLNPLFTKAYK